MNLFHYYHIWADGDWMPIVNEHLLALKRSGLYDRLATGLNVGIVGDWRQRDDVIAFIEDHCMRYHVVAEANDGWEQLTIDALAHDANSVHRNTDGYVLYAHTKGCANSGEFPDRWRKMMTYTLVDDWRNATYRLVLEAGQWDTAGPYFVTEGIYDPDVPVFAGVRGVSNVVAMLTEAAENAGVEYHYGGEVDDPKPVLTRVHYSGNFWWSTFDWLRRLPYPCPANTRHDAEMWIGRADDGAFPRAINLREGTAFDELRNDASQCAGMDGHV